MGLRGCGVCGRTISAGQKKRGVCKRCIRLIKKRDSLERQIASINLLKGGADTRRKLVNLERRLQGVKIRIMALEREKLNVERRCPPEEYVV